MKHISTCLWFNDQAEEATKFYNQLFPGANLGKTSRYSKTGSQVSGQQEASVMTVEIDLPGCKILALNGGPLFKFTAATSFFVLCESEVQINVFWEHLNTQPRMPLGEYPWARKYAWTADKFGVEWQLMLADSSFKVTPSLLFVNKLYGRGHEALNFYMSIFDNSEIKMMAEEAHHIAHCRFTLGDQEITLMEGAGEHALTFSPAFSLVVTCENQEEIDYYWNKLSQNGQESQCGWLTDQFGLSWQIVPAQMAQIMSSNKAEQAMQALLKMKKIEIAELIK